MESETARSGIGAATWTALGALALATATGCIDSQPCDPGLVLIGGACVSPSAPPAPEAGLTDAHAGAKDAKASDAAGEASAAATFFGKTCASAADCGGDAPVCGAPMFPTCSQMGCNVGEPNAGACPASWMCISIPGGKSVCLKM